MTCLFSTLQKKCKHSECLHKTLCECCEGKTDCEQICSVLEYCNFDDAISPKEGKRIDCVRKSTETFVLLEIKNRPVRNVEIDEIVQQLENTVTLIKDKDAEALSNSRFFLCVPKCKQKKRHELEKGCRDEYRKIKNGESENDDLMVHNSKYEGIRAIKNIDGVKIKSKIILCEDADVECQ